MKIEQNAEMHGLRINLSVETKDYQGHKIISESEVIQDYIKYKLQAIGEEILMEMLNAMSILPERRPKND